MEVLCPADLAWRLTLPAWSKVSHVLLGTRPSDSPLFSACLTFESNGQGDPVGGMAKEYWIQNQRASLGAPGWLSWLSVCLWLGS